MKKIIIKDYNTGKQLAKKSIPRAEFKSISYEVEYIGGMQYLIIRDYYTGEILHKFKKTGTTWDTSIEFYVVNED